jgi:hypothetical protein
VELEITGVTGEHPIEGETVKLGWGLGMVSNLMESKSLAQPCKEVAVRTTQTAVFGVVME